MKTSRAGSNIPWTRIQRRRARATSARSCSAARRLFFEGDLVALKEAPDRGATARNLVLAHRTDHLVQRQVRLPIDQSQQKPRLLLQWRGAPTPRLRGAATSLAKALHPNHRRTGADIVMFGRLTPRTTAFNPGNHALTHISRIGPRHHPAPKSESMPIESLIPGPRGILRFNRGGTCSSLSVRRSGCENKGGCDRQEHG